MSLPQRYRETFLQVRSDCVLVYEVSEFEGNRFKIKDVKGYKGKMTEHSKKRIMRAVDLLLQRSPERRIWNPIIEKQHDFRIAFVTLTIADQENKSARFCYDNLLRPFLRTAKRKWGVKDYIWKAELQERGQVHYHITWNEFVTHDKIRNEWNRLQKKNGLLQSFAAKFGHFHANSTDVHAVWKVRNLKTYLAKYIAKEEPNKKRLNGKVWDCSVELKRPYFSTKFSDRQQDVIMDAIEMGQAKMIRTDHCVIVEMKKPTGVLSVLQQKDYIRDVIN